MKPARSIREKLKRRELTTGILATNHVWPELVELSQRAGLDYLIVDLEHGPHSLQLVADVCAAGRHLNFPVFLRPADNQPTTLRRLIDQGPCGFLLAYVQSADELDAVRDAIRLPPRGHRRPGGAGNAWASNYLLEGWQHDVEEDFIVLPQIESRRGLENAVSIAAHELTTALAVGPYDLSADLGICGLMEHPHLLSALHQLRHIAAAVGKEMWMIGTQVERLVREGWRFICIGEPSSILQTAIHDAVQRAKLASSD